MVVLTNVFVSLIIIVGSWNVQHKIKLPLGLRENLRPYPMSNIELYISA